VTALATPSVGLSREIEEQLRVQEEFETLREKTTRRAGRGLCDLAYANAWDGPPERVVDALRDALSVGRELDLQYTPYGGSTLTRRLIARQLSESHGLAFRWRDVVLTPGAMAGLNLLFRALRRESARDEVVCITPCWMDYPLYLLNLGLVPRLVPVRPDTLRLDLDAIRDALGPNTRASPRPRCRPC
jgi:aspartate aminotransferase